MSDLEIAVICVVAFLLLVAMGGEVTRLYRKWHPSIPPEDVEKTLYPHSTRRR